MNKLREIHPLLIAVSPVLILFSTNVKYVSTHEILRPLLVMALFSCVVWSMLFFVSRSWTKAGIILSFFLLMFFSYGYVLIVLSATVVLEGWLRTLSHTVLPIFLLSGWGYSSYLITRTNKDLTEFANLLAFAGAAMVIFNLSHAAYWIGRSALCKPGIVNDGSKISMRSGIEKLPHVFYLVLDGYARADTLSEVYGYDNTEFLDYLKKKGFYVAHQSYANYSQTALSLASSLNLCYLDDLADQLGRDSDLRRPLGEMIRNNRVSAILRDRGYEFVSFSTGFSLTEVPSADTYLRPTFSLNQFEHFFLVTSPFVQLTGLSDLLLDAHRNRISYVFEKLVELSTFRSPKFILVHVMAAHPPFVFGASGEPVSDDKDYLLAGGSNFTGGSERYISRYRQQLKFSNELIKKSVSAILEGAYVQPIIIIQSDHGPSSYIHDNVPDDNGMRERMGILNAYLLPDKRHLYPEITPVNSFRIILNRYFGASLEILNDECFFSTKTRPFEFMLVTGKLRTSRHSRVTGSESGGVSTLVGLPKPSPNPQSKRALSIRGRCLPSKKNS